MASQEGCLDEAPTQQDATPSPTESILDQYEREGHKKVEDTIIVKEPSTRNVRKSRPHCTGQGKGKGFAQHGQHPGLYVLGGE
ncbi:hypothetical protein P5673_017960 [Acropora cervicornis]|uniref:Uncharacterized protein n=1 Tax=Acropora cervicornis TaxID=6130 RepID=A0AAD9QDL5_ACRCE|nr:hypothetical protein P5673_017960 [Acropora cervicornis]